LVVVSSVVGPMQSGTFTTSSQTFVCFCFMLHSLVVVLLRAWWGGPGGIEV